MIGSRRASTQRNESKTSLKTLFFSPKLGANTAMFGLRNMYKPHPAVSTHNSRIVKSLFLVHLALSFSLNLILITIFILICLFPLFLFYSNILILITGSKNQL